MEDFGILRISDEWEFCEFLKRSLIVEEKVFKLLENEKVTFRWSRQIYLGISSKIF